MRSFVLAALAALTSLSPTSGCARDLARASSGVLGCAPDAIEIHDVSVGWSETSWAATCRGTTFRCAGERSPWCAPLPAPPAPPVCTREIACEDAIVLDLGFVEGVVSEGEVTNVPDGDGFVSTVDASAGGLPNASTNPWIYLRFGDAGLERVDIDDLQSLASSDWHIAAKRIGVRLNSGTGGPACVRGAALDGMAYEDVTARPDDAALAAEAFYDETCTLIDDGSGQGAPAYVLTPWWTYPGCVATTGVPFVLELSDGRALKLVIDAYYAEGQAACNDAGAMGEGSAQFTWRWSFLE